MNEVPLPGNRHRNPRRRVILITIAAGGAMWLGWIAYQARLQKRAVEHLQTLNAAVRYDYETTLDESPSESVEPNILAGVFGRDFVANVVEVELRSFPGIPVTDADLAILKALPRLTRVSITGSNVVTDEGLVVLASLEKLEHVRLSKLPGVSNAGLESISRLSHLQTLILSAMENVTDEGLQHLAQLRNLAELTLWDCPISGQGFLHLKSAPLRAIRIRRCPIEDEAFAHLASAAKLERLSISDVNLNRTGLQHLRALPTLSNLELTKTGIDDWRITPTEPVSIPSAP
jgi:hypothetical protein